MADFKDLEYNVKAMLNGAHSPESLDVSHDTAKRIVTLAKNIATHTLDMVNHKAPVPKSHTEKSIRMSEIGEPCLRKLIYKWYHPMYGLPPYAEHPEPFLPVKFTYGDYIEELTLFLASEAGHSVKLRQAETRLPGTNGWYAIGHIDAVVDDTLVDVKSAADGSFNKYKREGLTEETDTFGYLWQLDSYAVSMGMEKRAFIFTNKHDGNLHIINRSDIEPLPVVDMITKIGDTVDEYLATAVLPEKMPTKATKYGNQLGTVCSYCAFKWQCYNGGITGIISSGRPIYIETVSLTPEGAKLAKEKTTITPPKEYQIPF